MIPWFLVGLLVGLPLSARSGSTVAIAIREAGRGGARSGLRASAGGALADLLMLLVLGALVLGEPTLLAGPGAAFLVLGLLGGGVLAFLGWRLMEDRTPGVLHRDRGNVLLRAYHENPILDRLLGALLDPLRILFWATAGLRLAAGAAGEGIAGVAALAAGFVLAGIGWPTFVAFRLAGSRRERALSDRQYRIVTSLGGLALVGVGFVLLVRAAASSGVRGALERVVAAVFGSA